VTEKEEKQTWQKIYEVKTKSFGLKYRKHYRRTFLIWKRLETWLKKSLPRVVDTLRKPITDTEIAQQLELLENKFELPLEYLCALKFHDGQSPPTNPGNIATVLFGGFEFYDFRAYMHFSSLSFSVGRFNELRRHIEEEHEQDDDSIEHGQANVHHTEGSLLFPVVISFPQPVTVYLNHKGHVIRSRMPPGMQVPIADSFLSFMESYVSRLESGFYSVKKNMIWRFADTGDAFGSDTTTHGIRIRANALFVPEHSSSRSYTFAYCIRISWAGGEDDDTRYQLTTRHWRQRQANGQIERIDGEGVIGLFPVIYKGRPDFQYCSCTRQSNPNGGQMSGSFDFRVGDTNEEISCTIGPFALDVDKTLV